MLSLTASLAKKYHWLVMSTLTIRKLPAEDHESLRIRAARNGRSMEEEARQILRAALREDSPNLEPFRRLRERIRARHGGELPKGEVDALLRERRAEAAREAGE